MDLVESLSMSIETSKRILENAATGELVKRKISWMEKVYKGKGNSGYK